MQLLEVQNLIFLLPLAASFFLILIMALGIPLGDHDVHADFDVSHTHLPDVHHGPHVHAPAGVMGNVLSFLGIGRVPFALTLITTGLLWGITGLVLNQVWNRQPHTWAIICTATGMAVLGTGYISNFIARFMPTVETYGADTGELTAKNAEVIHMVNHEGGTVRLLDSEGNMRDVAAKTTAGQIPIPRGTRVVLKDYDPATGIFHVEPMATAPQPA